MRFSEAWLREWVNPDVSTEQLAEQLTMAGLEVDSVEHAAPDFTGVVVGHVLGREQHPNADKLSLCQVDVGQGEAVQIICGASNVAADMKVPVAMVGGVLPGNFKIKKAKLRGVESFGMICSAAELGLAESSDGIMPLPGDAPVGANFREYLSLEDQCIEVDLTPNRGDCLGMIGLAREVGVLNGAPLTVPPIEPVTDAIDDLFDVSLEAPEACPRYLCRVIHDIDPKAETPLWMQERLRRGGIRSLSPVVDVTNYVLLELGQPMHGFDLDRLEGSVRVRMAETGESIELLNGETIELREDSLVIADEHGPVALAGIMGGEPTAVTDATSTVLLESAFFAPEAIAGKARSYGLATDSSHRFERGVDPVLQRDAMERATALLLDIVGGMPGPINEAVGDGFDPRRAPIELRAGRLARVLGVKIDDAIVEDILTRLGMGLESVVGGWQVTPPSARFDIALEEDLIEEVGRIYGYNNIPETPGHSGIQLSSLKESDFNEAKARELLIARDYHEVITYSFIAPKLARTLAPESSAIELANPLSTDMAVMRPTLWAGLIEAAKYNRARQQERIRLFESGLRFISQHDVIKQEKMISGVVLGSAVDEQWGQPARSADFFDLKGDVEAVLSLAGESAKFSFVADEHPALHPGQSARIQRSDGTLVGWMGQLHPALEKDLDVGQKAFVFELEIGKLDGAGKVPAFEPVSRFPAIRRDLAIVVDRGVEFENVKNCVRDAASELVQDIVLFDVYTGENVEQGRKSLALRLILQDSLRTLTDEDVNQVTQDVLEALQRDLNAKLRD